MNPTGIPTIKRPPLTLSLLFHSPNCDVAYKVDEAVGMQLSRFYDKMISYTGASSIVAAFYLWMIIRFTEQITVSSSVCLL